MQQRSYRLLLHDKVRAHLVSLGRQGRQRLREKLEYLQHGLWDGGVRVKKLKGAARAVFEARLSRGDRILFTLGRPLREEGAGATRIYVWGVVKHDAVTDTAQGIVPGNAPFLEFAPDAVEQRNEELDLDELSDDYLSPALDQPLRAAPAAAGDGAATDAGPQRWLVVDEGEWRRLQAADQGDHLELYLYLTREQARLLHSEPPLLLSGTAGSGKTTIAVYFLLRHRARELAAPPDGAAAAALPGGEPAGTERALFLTCSPHLKRFSERIYRGLVKATELERAPQAVRFATFEELLREIMTGAGKPRWQARPAGLAEFHAIFRNHPGAARYDAELVWEEIRSIIKGAKPPVSLRRFAELAASFTSAQAAQRERAELAEYLVRLGNLELGAKLDAARERKSSFASLQEFAASLRDGEAARRDEHQFLLAAALRLLEKQAGRLDQPLLTLREYEGLGRKRAPNFPFDRSGIYRLAEYYQTRLNAAGRYDEIDLTRAALHYLEQHGDQFRYDLVVCDEVQDLTDVQLALLFRLAADPRRTVLTGDPKQIINPSGFRWEEVRARYYERGLPVPEVINLSINFRSVGNIVSLANGLLLLKRKLVGLAGGEITERWTFRGRPPLLLDGLAEGDLLGTIAGGGAGQVVLVRTEQERDRVRKALQTELVFTINEAKGLEFDAVLLWRFSAAEGSPAIWRRIAEERAREDADGPHIRHELNLLYVAVTRARNTLVIWDGERVSPIWTIDSLAEQVYRSTDAAAFDTLWQRVSTPAEWEAQGDYFAEREHYAAAEECYRHAQAVVKEDLARARRLEREGEHRIAAGLFSRHGRATEAADNLEKAGAFREAARTWRRAKSEMRAVACEARHYEATGNHSQAALRWQQLGVEEGVLRNWEQGGEYRKLAQFHLERKAAGEAARFLKLAGDHAEAAAQFRRAGLPAFAAAEFEQAGDHTRAAALYRRVGDTDALLRCLLKSGAHHDAGLVYEKRGDLERAGDCFRRYVESSPQARRDLEQRLTKITPKRPGMRAAIRMAALGQTARAAPIYSRNGQPERAAELFSAAGDHHSAAECLAKCGRYQDAAEEVLRDGREESHREAVKYVISYLKEGRYRPYDRGHEVTRAAGRMLRAGQPALALAHYLAVGSGGDMYMEGATAAYSMLERHADALEYCLHHGRGAEALAYLDKRPELVLTVPEVERLASRNGDRPRLEDYRVNSSVKGVLLRLMHDCVYRGAAPDRRERIAALLNAPSSLFVYECPLFMVLSDLIIDLRCYELILGYLERIGAERDQPQEYFVSRLQRVAAEEEDPELVLCTLLKDPLAFEAALADMEPDERNLALFGRSARRYPEAVKMFLARGDEDSAVAICYDHRDHKWGGRIREQAGDLELAARMYRDSKHYADALRCYRALGDEVGVARVYERQGRLDESLAIWQRRGRRRDVERVRKKLARQSG